MIGVFGGTFDPVHFGHLRPALEVFEALSLRQMRFVPANQPPHRAMPVANGKQRETMLRVAIGNDSPGLVVDNRELRREGPSYMVDTLISMRDELKDESICLVLGMDAFLQLHTWHRWREILTLAHLVVTHRPGWLWDDDDESMAPELVELWQQCLVGDAAVLQHEPAGKILHLAVSQLDISATRIRALVAAGKSPRYLVPDPVWNLIRLQSLYGVLQNMIQDEKSE